MSAPPNVRMYVPGEDGHALQGKSFQAYPVGVRIGYHQAVSAVPLQIGPLRLASNLLLAPIAGYTDLAFRLVARSCGGVGLACTDLLCPEGVIRENRRSMLLAATCAEDAPLCMQL